MNFEIVLATHNKHKLKEFREILSPHQITVYGLDDLLLKIGDVEENKPTYFENALLKAEALQKLTSFPVIADDTGLEVEALDNGPGLFTARFAEHLGGYANAFKEIEKAVKEKGNDKATFICSLAVLNIEDRPLHFEARVNGRISLEELGKEGFGYDPIFIPEGSDKTYAQMGKNEKNKVSHRAKALLKFITYLRISRYIFK